MVGVTGFEPAASTSQTSRATNCATPRCVIFIRFLVIFRKWSNLWSDHFFVLVLEKRMCEKVSIYKGFRAFEKSRSQNRLHAPKPGAIPSFATPRCVKNMEFSNSGQNCGQNSFWGKMRQRELGFLPFFSRFLAFLRVEGQSDHLLPNVARYQLRHTPMGVFIWFLRLLWKRRIDLCILL